MAVLDSAAPHHAATDAVMKGGRRGDRTQARARQGARRRTFPLINSQVIAAADTGDVELLASTVEAYLPQMNLVNVATAMHRLAKVATSDVEARKALAEHPVMSAMAEALRAGLSVVGACGSPPQCQALSNTIWSLATLRVSDAPSLRRIAELAALHVEKFKPFELSSLLWGFAKLGEQDEDALIDSRGCFRAAAKYIAESPQQFSFRCLVMVCWSFSSANFRDVQLFRNISASLSQGMHTASCHELAEIARAYADMGVRQDKLFSDIAGKGSAKIADFKAPELLDMVRCFAKNGFFHRGFLDNAVASPRLTELSPSELCLFAVAVARPRPRHHSTCSAMLSLMRSCSAFIKCLSLDELASLVLAVGTCFSLTVNVLASGDNQVTNGTVPGDGAREEVDDFMQSVAAAIETLLPECPCRSIAAFTVGFACVDSDTLCGVRSTIIQEAVSRLTRLEDISLVVLLRTLPLCTSDVQVRCAVGALAVECARRSGTMQAAEGQLVAKTVAMLLEHADVSTPTVAPFVPSLAESAATLAAAALSGSMQFPVPVAVDVEMCASLTHLMAQLRKPASHPAHGVGPSATAKFVPAPFAPGIVIRPPPACEIPSSNALPTGSSV